MKIVCDCGTTIEGFEPNGGSGDTDLYECPNCCMRYNVVEWEEEAEEED